MLKTWKVRVKEKKVTYRGKTVDLPADIGPQIKYILSIVE